MGPTTAAAARPRAQHECNTRQTRQRCTGGDEVRGRPSLQQPEPCRLRRSTVGVCRPGEHPNGLHASDQSCSSGMVGIDWMSHSSEPRFERARDSVSWTGRLETLRRLHVHHRTQPKWWRLPFMWHGRAPCGKLTVDVLAGSRASCKASCSPSRNWGRPVHPRSPICGGHP